MVCSFFCTAGRWGITLAFLHSTFSLVLCFSLSSQLYISKSQHGAMLIIYDFVVRFKCLKLLFEWWSPVMQHLFSVNSGSWWWTGRPGVLWVMGSQRVGYDWATDLICLLFPSVPSPSLLLLFLFVFHIDGSLDHITALKRTNILSAVELAFCTYRILKHTQYILKNHSNLWNVKRKYFSYICNCNYQSPKCHSVHLTSKDPISTWVA